MFYLFAEDTGILEPRDTFLRFIEEHTAGDGADLGPWLARLLVNPNASKTQPLARALAMRVNV